jgi:hypothetical protein
LLQYHKKSTSRLHLIPAENKIDVLAIISFIMDTIHRYCFSAENDNIGWPGLNDLLIVKDHVSQSLPEIFGVKHINV